MPNRKHTKFEKIAEKLTSRSYVHDTERFMSDLNKAGRNMKKRLRIIERYLEKYPIRIYP